MTGWTVAIMGISGALGASTLTELKHGKKGMSVTYMWLRSLLFTALATVLFINPTRTGEANSCHIGSLVWNFVSSVL